MNKTVGLDIEGTLVELHKEVLKHYNQKNNTNLKKEDFDWHFNNVPMSLSEFHKISREKIWKKNELDNIPFTEKNIPSKVNKLNKKYEVNIVTGRKLKERLKKWAENIGIKYNNFHIKCSKNKTNLDYDIYIDDSPVILKNLKKDQELFLYSQPWNKQIDTSEYENVVRIEKISEII
ncbi:MAG: 5' nucleotidase, NT5C type [archaeon]